MKKSILCIIMFLVINFNPSIIFSQNTSTDIENLTMSQVSAAKFTNVTKEVSTLDGYLKWKNQSTNPFSKTSFALENAGGNTTQRLLYAWQNDEWNLQFRYTYAYDDNGNTIQSKLERLENSEWIDAIRITYEFDANNHETQYLEELWDGVWVNSARNTSEYDDNGNQIQSLRENWEDGSWVNKSIRTYEYDTGNNEILSLSENWENGAWVKTGRNITEYDVNGNATQTILQNWFIDKWVNSWKDTYDYNSNGDESIRLNYRWGNSSNVWIVYSRTTFTYDLNRNIILREFEKMENQLWVDSLEHHWAYDANGNMTLEYLKQWQDGIPIHIGMRRTFEYNADGDLIQILEEEWEGGVLYKKRKSIYSIGVITGIDNKNNSLPNGHELSQNYPNPFNPETNISYSIQKAGLVEVNVYNVTGRLVKNLVRQQQMSGKYSVMWNGTNSNGTKVSSGLYFYQLKVGNVNIVRKMQLIK